MALHKMGPLIKSAFQQRNGPGIKQCAGVEIINSSGTSLYDKQMLFGGGKHTEKVLFDEGEFQRCLQRREPAKVYLYTFFGPCPECSKFLKPYPAKYAGVKFSLAYSDGIPAGYNQVKMEKALKSLHKAGWKVRMWRYDGGDAPPEKRWKRFEDNREKIDHTYPVPVPAPVLVPWDMFTDWDDWNMSPTNE